MTTERHRFRTNAPNVSVPTGFRDLYCDADGNLVKESPDGTKIPLDKITIDTPSDGTAVLSLEEVRFNTANGAPTTMGGLGWDSANETLSLALDHGAILQVGEEVLYHVENNTGSLIPNGTPVEYAGTVGNSGKIRVRPWTGAEPLVFLGLATTDIENGDHGYVTHFGKVRGIQTDGDNYDETWVDGDQIYASLSGGLTKTQPRERKYVFLGFVISAHPSNGTIFVRPRQAVSLVEYTLVNTPAATLDPVPQVVLVDDDTAGETVTITLPDAADAANVPITIKKVGATADVVIVGTIDGAASLTLRYQNSSAALFCNGVAYAIT